MVEKDSNSSSQEGSSSFITFWRILATMIASSYLKQTIITVLCVLGIPSYLSAPKPISVHLEGQSSIFVPADRAIVSLRIHAEGPKQDRVADEVRKAADDILATMRPLAQVSLPPSDNPQHNTSAYENYEPAIVDFSVTTFRSYSWLKPGSSLLSRDTSQYESSMEIEAQFRDFDALGLLLAQVSKQPSISVRYLKWTLDETTKRQLYSKCRSQAMVDAIEKVRAYVRPLGMDKVRAISFSEEVVRSRDRVMADLSALSHAQHDELDVDDALLPGSEGTASSEKFGLEPQTLEIAAQIDGQFCAWKTGLEAWFRRGGV